MLIRPMQETDFVPLMDLVIDFAEESLSAYGTLLEEGQLYETFIMTKDTSFVLLVKDKVVGVLAGRIVHDFCSSELVYEEVIWYTGKEYRKDGLRLLSFVEQWCKDKGIRRMTMCHMGNLKTDKLSRLYERLGYVPIETRYIKEIN